MIRKIKAADLDMVAQIWLDTNLKAHDFIPPEYWKGNYDTVKAMISQAEVYVYTDEDGMVVVTLPTLAEAGGFSGYEPESEKEVRELDYKVKEEVQGFLEDFFKVYPVSQETELKYYAKPGTVEVIAQEGFEYQEINEMKITEYEDDMVKVSVKVTYLFQSTQTRQTQQYELTLQKTDNWKIIEVR